MLWNDLRTYIEALRLNGDLQVVELANCEEEIGAISELMIEREGPGLLFDSVPGHPKGFRVASNLLNTPERTALALGLDRVSKNYSEQWMKRMASFTPLEPKIVKDGPIFSNVQRGADVDLSIFPTPKWHELDGGRYIGTGVCVINRSPDGVINIGSYRVSLFDDKTCSIFIEPGKHGYHNAQHYWNRGDKCPVAVSFGQDPVLTSLAGPTVYVTPEGVSEYDVAGYVQDYSYLLVEGPVTGIPFPATSEIVIEGFIPPPTDRLELEGPFGEWTGYYAHGKRPELVIEVEAVYFRDDPILFGEPPTRPLGCDFAATLGTDDTRMALELEAAGIPGIRGVSCLGKPSFGVVSFRQMYEHHVEDVTRIVAPGGAKYRGNQTWVLVDDDIDPHNSDQVLWAIASRLSPATGVTVVPGTGVWQLDPRIPPDERSQPDMEGRTPYTAHDLVLNCCRPYKWMDEFPPVAANGEALRQRTLANWSNLFET